MKAINAPGIDRLLNPSWALIGSPNARSIGGVERLICHADENIHYYLSTYLQTLFGREFTCLHCANTSIRLNLIFFIVPCSYRVDRTNLSWGVRPNLNSSTDAASCWAGKICLLLDFGRAGTILHYLSTFRISREVHQAIYWRTCRRLSLTACATCCTSSRIVSLLQHAWSAANLLLLFPRCSSSWTVSVSWRKSSLSVAPIWWFIAFLAMLVQFNCL